MKTKNKINVFEKSLLIDKLTKILNLVILKNSTRAEKEIISLIDFIQSKNKN